MCVVTLIATMAPPRQHHDDDAPHHDRHATTTGEPTGTGRNDRDRTTRIRKPQARCARSREYLLLRYRQRRMDPRPLHTTQHHSHHDGLLLGLASVRLPSSAPFSSSFSRFPSHLSWCHLSCHLSSPSSPPSFFASVFPGLHNFNEHAAGRAESTARTKSEDAPAKNVPGCAHPHCCLTNRSNYHRCCRCRLRLRRRSPAALFRRWRLPQVRQLPSPHPRALA